MSTIAIIDENELVVEGWGANTELATSWNEAVVQSLGGQG